MSTKRFLTCKYYDFFPVTPGVNMTCIVIIVHSYRGKERVSRS